MVVNVFVEVAKQYGFKIDSFEKDGNCEILFDGKHKVAVYSEDSSLIFKAAVVELSADQQKRFQQLKTALKTSLALVKLSLAAPYREGEVINDDGEETVELSRELMLYRKFDCRELPRFEVEKELEGFLAALEVYKSRLVTTKGGRAAPREKSV